MNLKIFIALFSSLLLLQGCTVQPKKSASPVVVQPELNKVDEQGRMNVDPKGPQPVPKTSQLDNWTGLTLS